MLVFVLRLGPPLPVRNKHKGCTPKIWIILLLHTKKQRRRLSRDCSQNTTNISFSRSRKMFLTWEQRFCFFNAGFDFHCNFSQNKSNIRLKPTCGTSCEVHFFWLWQVKMMHSLKSPSGQEMIQQTGWIHTPSNLRLSIEVVENTGAGRKII